MDAKDLNVSVNDREEMVFEVPNGYECAIKKVDGKSKVVMRKLYNVLKESGLSYDDFEMGNKEIMNLSTYRQIQAINVLSYIRTHDKDFLSKNVDWKSSCTLCYVGWDEYNGNIEIRKLEYTIQTTDIQIGNELLIFTDEDEANRFIKRYSESIDMGRLLSDYYRLENYE